MGKDDGVETAWEAVRTPFDADLEAAVHAADGPYAAGEEGILVAGGPNDWEPVIERDALEADGDLRAVDATRDGERVWFAGDNGVLGMFDVETGAAVGYDYTGTASSTWCELAVTGAAGDERALLANEAGAVVSFELDGEELAFSEPTRASESPVVALTTTETGVGHAVDADGAVHTATATGWEALGTIDAEGDPTDVAATQDRLLVAATDGCLYEQEHGTEYEQEHGTEWRPTVIADEEVLAVEASDRETVAVVPESTIYTREDRESAWERSTVDTGDRLTALVLGAVDVAVGENGAVARRFTAADETDERAGEPADEADNPDETAALPPVEDEPVAIEEAENAVDDAEAAVADAANAAESTDAEAAVEAVAGATEDVEDAAADAAHAAGVEGTMDEHTQLIVEELLSRAETEDLVDLLRESESGSFELRERLADVVVDHAHDCADDGCSCGPECDCGDDCRCDETGNCECENCTCGHDECTCGTVSAGCTCGGNCDCGHDCTCGSSKTTGRHAHDCSGDGCSCGPGCDCGHDCACGHHGSHGHHGRHQHHTHGHHGDAHHGGHGHHHDHHTHGHGHGGHDSC